MTSRGGPARSCACAFFVASRPPAHNLAARDRSATPSPRHGNHATLAHLRQGHRRNCASPLRDRLHLAGGDVGAPELGLPAARQQPPRGAARGPRGGHQHSVRHSQDRLPAHAARAAGPRVRRGQRAVDGRRRRRAGPRRRAGGAVAVRRRVRALRPARDRAALPLRSDAARRAACLRPPAAADARRRAATRRRAAGHRRRGGRRRRRGGGVGGRARRRRRVRRLRVRGAAVRGATARRVGGGSSGGEAD